MQPVAVRILHPSPSSAAGPLERALARARTANGRRLAALFRASGVADVRIETGTAEARSFGERLGGLIAGLPAAGGGAAGLVVLGSGSIPLATRRDAADLVAVAASGERRALANNRYSADVIAIGGASNLAPVPDLPSDNALPRWLEETAGYQVEDLRRRWRLAMDLDSPLDAVLTRRGMDASLDPSIDASLAIDRIARLRSVAADRRAELVLAGRTSATTLRWLERRTASRTRALVEERGLRAIGLARPAAAGSPRLPRSVLGLVLDNRGPDAFGEILAELGDGAIVDSRVLLAHRLGPDESGWPAPEDRFASDLLLADRIRDPWLRALTAAARDSAIPLLLGGHTLVGPGVRLVLGRHR